MKYFIKIFGCSANVADGERIAASYNARGNWQKAINIGMADEVVIVTCSIRQSAEDRVVGLVRNLEQEKQQGRKLRIIVTGCMVGMAVRDQSGKLRKKLQSLMPLVDEFLPIEEVGFSQGQLRTDKKHALVPISNGCNNFCSFCVVPFARGREVSRPYEDILFECRKLAASGYSAITLVGQNVNSYGSDLKYKDKRPVYVKHLGRLRIPTLFPHLLQDVAHIENFQFIDFISSNPWDFSDALIEVIAQNKNISRLIHLPVQSGDALVLRKMNRWYTPREYLTLVSKIRKKIPEVTFSTDIIVGFPGETERQFVNTVSLCKKVGFVKAYISMYSDRPQTAAHKTMTDSVSYKEKKKRWDILDELVNKTNLRNGVYPVYE